MQHTHRQQKNANHYLALLAACKENNASQALSLILPWSNQLFIDNKTEIRTMAQLTLLVNDQHFAIALNNLQQYLYGKSAVTDAASWQGNILLNAIQTVNQKEQKINDTSEELSLNP